MTVLSLHSYHMAILLSRKDPPFYALIAAAMLKADTDNANLLKSVFPQIWSELTRRYEARLGILPEDGAVNPELLQATLTDLKV